MTTTPGKRIKVRKGRIFDVHYYWCQWCGKTITWRNFQLAVTNAIYHGEHCREIQLHHLKRHAERAA
jgi:hypothetical protein